MCPRYIPKADPDAFPISKTNNNILQGAADPETRFDERKQALLNEWIGANAKLYWLSLGGPLSPGGADIINHPQLAALIPLIKKALPEVKIVYRSYIEVRKDLVERVGTHQEQVDVSISHPVEKYVPNNVQLAMIGLMPACADWCVFSASCLFFGTDKHGLDVLNKPLGERVLNFNPQRLHPSKGIPDVIESYSKLWDRIIRDATKMLPPQLLICGHGAIDDPDAEIVFVEVTKLLKQSRYAAMMKDVVAVRIGPSDQMLNVMVTKVKIVLQLSLSEGFKVKVSEALHHGKPIFATRAGGIPLQIKHGKSGFLADVGDTESVANHLFDLYTNDDIYARMSQHANASVSDDVGTVGNAACWFYLTSKLARSKVLSLVLDGSWTSRWKKRVRNMRLVNLYSRVSELILNPKTKLV
ncbi:clock-controlled-9 protein [Tuber indicum]|nr:clock-controlled-9 protein [Tuber indicum]